MPDRRRTARAAALAVVAALLAFVPARVLAANGDDLLRKAIVADDHVSYAGTITTLVYGAHGADATVVRVDHVAPNKWRMWYVAPADAYGRLIVSNESVTYQYEPKLATVYSDDWAQSSPGVTLELDAAKVLKNYRVEENPGSDVAGRKSISLSLVSKHSGTLVERVWLDSTTNLVLERETYHSDGTIESKSSFDDVRLVKNLPKELFDLTVPPGMHVAPGATFAKAGKDVATLQSTLNFSVISPKYLPEGFTLDKASLASRDGIQSIELLYTDGLRDFSLFENSTERLPDLATSKAIDVGDASGVTTHLAGETLVSWNANGLNITMVGNLTSQELAKIGASIKP
jgi:outer membrane lipoprotein-sorting protein